MQRYFPKIIAITLYFLEFSMFQSSVYSLSVPHALVSVDKTNEICVADREHGRIVCYNYYSGGFTSDYQFTDVTGGRLFSLAYSPVDGGKFYVVNGPEPYPTHRVSGFIINIPNKTVEAYFNPENGEFKNPHDVAVNALGNWVYVVELSPMKVHKFGITYKDNFTIKVPDIPVRNVINLDIPKTSDSNGKMLSFHENVFTEVLFQRVITIQQAKLC